MLTNYNLEPIEELGVMHFVLHEHSPLGAARPMTPFPWNYVRRLCQNLSLNEISGVSIKRSLRLLMQSAPLRKCLEQSYIVEARRVQIDFPGALSSRVTVSLLNAMRSKESSGSEFDRRPRWSIHQAEIIVTRPRRSA
jgi:hypothetical protein